MIDFKDMEDVKETINVQGARVHNLKNIDLKIPRDKLVIFTGISGSGKSSLAFDTLFSESRRRFLDCLSARSRQGMDQPEKPEVDSITGLPPALCLYFARKSSDQKEARLIRNLSALSLGLTLLGLLLAILTAPMGGSLASAVNLFLSIVSAPMYCGSSWAVSLFFWACLLLTGAKYGT